MQNSLIMSNTALNEGGGISNQNARLTIMNSRILSNTAQGNGGGLNNLWEVVVQNSVVANNITNNSGGGISHQGVTASFIDNSVVANNRAGGSGGGIEMGKPITLQNSIVSTNTAQQNGGGINAHLYLTVLSSTIVANQAGYQGGGLFSREQATIINSLILDNQALTHIGGGVVFAGDAAVRNSLIHGNRANNHDGGGLVAYGINRLDISHTRITSNTAAASGGGVWGAVIAYMDHVTVTHNSSGGGGGGIAWLSRIHLDQSLIMSNTAGSNGGGLNLSSSTVWLTDTTVISNSASGDGGGVWSNGIALNATTLTLSGNNASGNGGGMHTVGTTTITQSVIMSNTAQTIGSGIAAWNELSVLTSTISHNQGGGGGIYVFGPASILGSTLAHNGRGLAIQDDPVQIENSTISHNLGDGIWLQENGASVVLTHTTLVSNTDAGISGNVGKAVTVTARASIIAHHPGNNCAGDTLVKQSLGHNLTSDSSCGLAAAGDVVVGDVGLGELALNGGATANHIPLVGSLALDTIPAADCLLSQDQRGLPRPFNTNCDKGSIEQHPDSPPVSPTVTISVTAGNGLILNWATDPANCNYTIYRSTDPFASFSLLGMASTAPYLVTNGAGNPATNYFYRVVASSCPAGTQTADSQTMGVFSFALKPGN